MPTRKDPSVEGREEEAWEVVRSEVSLNGPKERGQEK